MALVAVASATSPFEQVVAAERAFAALSVREGLHKAFLANLAEDAVSFHPTPEPARPHHLNKPPSKGVLDWGPAWVALSSAGDLAVSIGPWSFKAPPNPVLKPETTGIYVSIWRKPSSGTWKVAVDSGVGASVPFEVPSVAQNGLAGAPIAPPTDPSKAQQELAAAERTFASAAKSALGLALEAQADPLLRAYRDNHIGDTPETVQGIFRGDQRKAACKPDRIVAANSGDLAYAYGTCDNIAADKTEKSAKLGFLRVWRRQPDGSWKILVDVTTS